MTELILELVLFIYQGFYLVITFSKHGVNKFFVRLSITTLTLFVLLFSISQLFFL